MRIKNILKQLVFLSLIYSATAIAQQNSSSSAFSLKEAQDYAVKNSIQSKNAQLDYELAKAKKNEIRGIGLPQINGSADTRYNQRTIFESLINHQLDNLYENQFKPLGFSRDQFDAYIEQQQAASQTANTNPLDFSSLIGTTFNSRHNGTLALNASQLLFSSEYLIALKASKALLELNEKSIQKSNIDVKLNVAKAYYGVLVAREKAKLLDVNIVRLQKLKSDTRVLNENGFVEKIDLDRVEVAYNNLVTEREKLKNYLNLNENLLKFQMNYDILQPIVLTDTQMVNNIDQTPVVFGKIDYNSRIEYSLLKTSEKLGKMDLDRYRLSYIPTLAAYGSLQYQAFAPDKKFDFYYNQPWYRVTAIGASLSVPIFSGGQKYYKVQQAKLNLMKTQNTVKSLESAISLEVSTAAVTYNNALLGINNQKRNMDLAEGVYKVAKTKYDQGVGSNLEVLTAETSLKEAQTNYFSALFDYYIAKTDYDKATGNIK